MYTEEDSVGTIVLNNKRAHIFTYIFSFNNNKYNDNNIPILVLLKRRIRRY